MLPFEAAEFAISLDYSRLPGYFPGNPVVPGVVIFPEVLACRLAQNPGNTVNEVIRVKSVSLLRPEELCSVSLSEATGGRVGFDGRVDDRGVATGLTLVSL